MIINVEIESENFTLFYDYDYKKLSKLTDDGKIEADFSNPEYERKKDSYYYCKINGGDGRIEINTRDGDIILREVK